MFNLTHAINIIDWKIKNPIVPKGEKGCKELEPRILGEFNGHTVTLKFADNGHCRFLRYNGDNYYINDKNKNLDNFTLEDAVKTFQWDRKKI